MKYSFLLSAVAAIGSFQGGKVCDPDMVKDTIFLIDKDDDYKLSQSSCLKKCMEEMTPMDEENCCCEYGSTGDDYFYCSLTSMDGKNALKSQEYLAGFEDQDWYWATMMNGDMDMKDDDWMMGGANTLALEAASIVALATMF